MVTTENKYLCGLHGSTPFCEMCVFVDVKEFIFFILKIGSFVAYNNATQLPLAVCAIHVGNRKSCRFRCQGLDLKLESSAHHKNF